MLNLTNNRGVGMYFGGSYAGNYAQWIQVSDTGNLGVNYPLLLNPNGGNVGIGTASPLGNLEIQGANRAIGSDGILQVNSNNSQAIDLGGSISFGGVWTGTSVTEWASISGRKENSTAGQYGAYLSLGTRPHLGVITERMRINSSGVVLINNTYASPYGVLNTFKTPVASTYVDQIVVQSTGNYPSLRLGTYDAYDAVIATTGNDLRILAGLDVYTEDHNIRFYTSFIGGTGGAQAYERMRITSDGYMRMATGTGGIQFNGDTAATNALDDYEEGTWTPTLPNGGTLNNLQARYVKIGKKVTLSFYSNLIEPTNNSSNFIIGGLPFANAGLNPSLYFGGSFGYVGAGNLFSYLPITGANFNYIYFHANNGTSATKTNANFISDMGGGNREIIITITYFTA